ncbi:MAG: hypothetical protein K2N95_13445 [Lachnospiraceae bacterium]|nr:hypothetical protein [Lachnospiraceae bacterium]
MVDTMMLSTVGDNAVGAVGTANTYINVFIIMFGIVSSGMIAVMAQYIGAERTGVVYQARQLGAVLNLALGVALSAFLFVFSGDVLEIVGVAPLLMDYAKMYLKIVGSFCFVNALIPAIDIILEVGRVTNLVFGQALKTIGDALHTTVIAVIFMYLCMVGGTWLFGIRLNMLAAGAYIGLAGDECVRAVFLFQRWQSGRWKTKGLSGSKKGSTRSVLPIALFG